MTAYYWSTRAPSKGRATWHLVVMGGYESHVACTNENGLSLKGERHRRPPGIAKLCPKCVRRFPPIAASAKRTDERRKERERRWRP